MSVLEGIVAGSAAGLAWMALWGVCVARLGIGGVPGVPTKREDRLAKRERLRRIGKLQYILVFGIGGAGLAFGLGITVADVVPHSTHSWSWGYALTKLALIAVVVGWLNAERSWREIFRDPVPFPPNYPPADTHGS